MKLLIDKAKGKDVVNIENTITSEKIKKREENNI